MDFLLWIISWFEFPIFGILFFISVPESILQNIPARKPAHYFLCISSAFNSSVR